MPPAGRCGSVLAVRRTPSGAALVAQGAPAVGLTGVDAGGRAVRVQNHQSTSGSVVDLGFVGDPVEADPALVELLLSRGYVPVIAGLGVERDGALLNVNADVMACRIAASVAGSELVIAGATPGVLDAQGRSISVLDLAGIDDLISNGTATADGRQTRPVLPPRSRACRSSGWWMAGRSAHRTALTTRWGRRSWPRSTREGVTR
jgi:acetylglutamate kinase